MKANNEKLPYPDKYFDCYISNLSLMLVANHKNQLKEAYRVLQEDGTAGFTVWGRKENSEFFTFFGEVLKAAEIEGPEAPPRSNFHLGDIQALDKDFKEAGFKQTKLYYAPTNYLFNSSDELYHVYTHMPTFQSIYAELSEEKKTKLKQEFDRMYNERFGPDTIHPVTWEVLVCIVKK